MKLISLSKGKVAIVDDDMYEFLSQQKWCAIKDHNRWYAIRKIRKQPGAYSVSTFMHHHVVGYPLNKLVTDHINREGLDNRRENLRIVTVGENNRNQEVTVKRERDKLGRFNRKVRTA